MSPYNALSSYTPRTLPRSPSTTKYTDNKITSSYSSNAYRSPSSLSWSSKYYTPSSYSSYSSPSSYTYPSSRSSYSSVYSSTRNVGLHSSTVPSPARLPKVTSVSAYADALSKPLDFKRSSIGSGDRLYRSPSLSLSRRSSTSSSRTPSYTVSSELSQPYRSSSLLQTHSDDEDDKTRAKVGLNNLGNTCFMNAVLQCLCHTPPLMDYCLRGSHLNDINYRSQTRGDLMKVFADFMKNMAESKTKSAISPYQLRREVQRYASRFCGDSQQDAQEFLRYLLQGLHDDINRIKYKNNTVRSSFKTSDESVSWRNYREGDDSLIVDLFAGQLKSTLKCTTCNNESITYDPFWDISLPIPEVSRSTSLRQCFQLFSSPEILDGPNKPLCEICKKKTRASKKIEVSKFPKVLVIHLKRFSGTNYGHKLSTVVDCPMKIVNMSDFSSSNSLGDDFSYNLYGVVDHDGSNNSGHYTAKCKNQLSEEWYEFNDSIVSKASDIVSYKTYILFYIQERNFRK